PRSRPPRCSEGLDPIGSAMLLSARMRRFLPGACLLIVATACRSSCGGGSAADAGSPVQEAGPAASGAIPSASASAGTIVARGLGRCDPRRDAAVCSADGKEQLSCGLGMYVTVQICDGPAGCKGSGDDLVC